MFEIGKEYNIARVYNGSGDKGNYAFINIEDTKGKRTEKLTICVWGTNVEANQNDCIVINSVQSFGVKAKKDQKGAWREELQCTCEPSDFDIVKMEMDENEEPPQMQLTPVDDKLPF